MLESEVSSLIHETRTPVCDIFCYTHQGDLVFFITNPLVYKFKLFKYASNGDWQQWQKITYVSHLFLFHIYRKWNIPPEQNTIELHYKE